MSWLGIRLRNVSSLSSAFPRSTSRTSPHTTSHRTYTKSALNFKASVLPPRSASGTLMPTKRSLYVSENVNPLKRRLDKLMQSRTMMTMASSNNGPEDSRVHSFSEHTHGPHGSIHQEHGPNKAPASHLNARSSTSGSHTTVHSHPQHNVNHPAPPHPTPNIDDPLFETAFFDDDTLTQFQVPFYQISMANGVASVAERKISKYELSYETGMPLRDLRPFTHQLNRKLQVAGLVTRPRSFLINCEPLQAIVMPDRMQIFNVEPEDQPYMTALMRKMQRPSQAAFEHRALECILSITVKRLEQEASSFDERLTSVLNNATRNPNSQHLWDLREISDTIEAHGAYVDQTLGAIAGVLQKDEYMNMMYLSRNASGKQSSDHRDVELILEAAEDRLQALDHSCTMQQARITNAEQFLAVSNDTQRNEIIRITLYATILSLGFSAVAVIGSTFGMNLVSGLEDSPTMFWSVVLGMGCLFLCILAEGAYMIRKIDSDRPRSKAGRSVKF